MAFKNTVGQYGSVAKFFHWIIALLVIILILVGFLMDDVSDKALKMQVYNYHKLFGLTVLALVILRLFWRLISIIPPLPAATPLWEKALEKLVKLGLYLAMFGMPLSGWIFSTAAGKPPHLGTTLLSAPYVPVNPQIRDIFHTVHVSLAWILIGLLVLHLAGALKHHYINKDSVLKRMMPGGKIS